MNLHDIRYKCLGYVALNVSDINKSRYFYETLVGLQVDEPIKADVTFLRCSHKHHDIMLNQSGSVPGLKRIAWQMESRLALAAVKQQLQSLGLPIIAVSKAERDFLHIIGEAFRTTDPTTGATLEFYAEMAKAETDYQPGHTQIARLGHVVLNSADRAASEQFYLEQLNFRMSDHIENMVTFLRCFPNPYHHSFGLGSGQKSSLNHVNFMVTGLDDIGKANNRMKQNGVYVFWGPGKHPPSESLFLYFSDPDGFTVEYSCGMEEFPEQDPRPPRNMPATVESLDYWGGYPDPDFGKTGVLEPLRQGNKT
jgi:2,3-dihydroxy-p-cumate/2,3-dihydroxybenzoate 3,4-dioxygenase